MNINSLMSLLTLTQAATTGKGGTTGGAGSSIMMIVWIVVIFAAMYFFMIRPQKKQQKKEEAMRNNTTVGDEVISICGFYGKVVAVKEDSFIIECGPDKAKLRISKTAIQHNLTVHEEEPKEVTKTKKKKAKKEDK